MFNPDTGLLYGGSILAFTSFKHTHTHTPRWWQTHWYTEGYSIIIEHVVAGSSPVCPVRLSANRNLKSHIFFFFWLTLEPQRFDVIKRMAHHRHVPEITIPGVRVSYARKSAAEEEFSRWSFRVD